MKELSLHILDLMQNSLSAEATEIVVEIIENAGNDLYSISIRDNGKGMTSDMVGKVTDPYFTTRTTRKVGLGVPLLKEHAERTGGYLTVDSAPGQGTCITASFSMNHVDRQPLGDIGGVIVQTVASNPEVRFRYSHTTGSGTYTFDSQEVIEVLGSTPINNAEVITFLKEMISENLKCIKYIP